MKTVVFVLLDEYADWEGAYLSSQFNQLPNWTVKTASVQQEVSSMGGFKTSVDYFISDIPADVELLVLIGGNSWYLESQELTNLVSNRLVTGKKVAAICGAVDFLARNGLLNDRKHTGNAVYLWQEYEQYTNTKGFVEQQVVVDSLLVTANGTATLSFTNEVLKLVNAMPDDQVDQTIALHQLGFYTYCEKFGNPYA